MDSSVNNSNILPSMNNSKISPLTEYSNISPSIKNPDTSPSIKNSDTSPSIKNYDISPSIKNYDISPSTKNSDISPSINDSNLSPSINNGQTTALSLLSKVIKQSRKVFIGTYLERRYVHQLQAYRDIVVVENDEQDLITCLEEIKKVALEECEGKKWIGITCDMKDSVIQSYNLWIELKGIPLGRHWFKLRSIKVTDQAIQLNLKYLRSDHSYERKSLNFGDHTPIDYRELITYENASGTLRFLAVLVMSILTVACNALWYFGDYSLKLTHELSGMIKALTPIVFRIIDFFTKCIGGFYWLMYMLWRGNPTPDYEVRRPIRSSNPYNTSPKFYDRRAICYK